MNLSLGCVYAGVDEMFVSDNSGLLLTWPSGDLETIIYSWRSTSNKNLKHRKPSPNMQSMMRAVALTGAYNITVMDVPKPTIENSTDALVRITASALCGSDLHYYHQGQGSPEEPVRIGHEAIGYIEEVGDAVEFLNVGDYVVVPFALDDGHFQYGPTVDYVRAGADGMQGVSDPSAAESR